MNGLSRFDCVAQLNQRLINSGIVTLGVYRVDGRDVVLCLGRKDTVYRPLFAPDRIQSLGVYLEGRVNLFVQPKINPDFFDVPLGDIVWVGAYLDKKKGKRCFVLEALNKSDIDSHIQAWNTAKSVADLVLREDSDSNSTEEKTSSDGAKENLPPLNPYAQEFYPSGYPNKFGNLLNRSSMYTPLGVRRF